MQEKPQHQHDCDVSFVEAVGKCHFLGRDIDGDGRRLDLYIHVRDSGMGVGRSELIARFGDAGDAYHSAALADMLDPRWRPNGYALTLALRHAEAAGYDMAELLAGLDGRGSQAREDELHNGGDPYALTGGDGEGIETLLA